MALPFKITFAQVMALLGVVLGLGVANIAPPAALTAEAMWALGLLVWAICAWVGQVFDDYVVALIMALGWIVLGIVPLEVAFATFHSRTWWLLVGALGLGAGVAKSGLLKRTTLHMLSLMPASYMGQALALFITGVIVCPAIPSVTAKVAITGKFIPALARGMGVGEKSRASAGLFLAMYLGFVLAAPMYMTATSTNLFLVELLPAAEVSRMTWIFWLRAATPPVLLAAVLGFVAIMLLYKPKEHTVADKAEVRAELRALGPLSHAEKVTLMVLLTALLAWITEGWHGQQPATVALAALAVLLASKSMDKKTFHVDIGWSSLVFLGVILNVAQVFQRLRIDVFLGEQLLPLLTPVAGRLYLFAGLLMLVTMLLRFVMVSINALLALLMLILLPVAQAVGMSAWALGMIIHLSAHAVFFMLYQNIVYAVGYEAAEGKAITEADGARFSLIFAGISFVIVLLALPYWRYLGLL